MRPDLSSKREERDSDFEAPIADSSALWSVVQSMEILLKRKVLNS
jgi:hypothetical protein